MSPTIPRATHYFLLHEDISGSSVEGVLRALVVRRGVPEPTELLVISGLGNVVIGPNFCAAVVEGLLCSVEYAVAREYGDPNAPGPTIPLEVSDRLRKALGEVLHTELKPLKMWGCEEVGQITLTGAEVREILGTPSKQIGRAHV